jgi:[ribosomal protein S5]-alanine N-acetyltransferase
LIRPVDRIELIEIRADGSPSKDCGVLSEIAAETCVKTAAHYKKAGFSPPWISYLARLDSDVVGICAYVAAPSAGRVEIAYHTFPPFEGRDVATAMVKELVRRARSVDSHIELSAQTLAEENASNAILRKLGFQFSGTLTIPEEGAIWEWRLPSS